MINILIDINFFSYILIAQKLKIFYAEKHLLEIIILKCYIKLVLEFLSSD